MNRKSTRPPQYEETATWRLIISPPQDGATNMALDEAIADAVIAGEAPPTLRFYSWDPPCLSLGYAQEWDEVVDEELCEKLGWDVVRRATGGRAILHTDELTYSVAAPKSEPRVAGGVLESYQRLSFALLHGLKLMGLEPARAQPYYEDQGEQGPACYDGPSNYEITIGQRKLLGSAQKRLKQGGVLQHGTLPLTGDITRIAQGLYFDMPGQRMALQVRLRYRATTLAFSLGRELTFAQAADYMSQGFAQSLNLNLDATTPTPAELDRAATLRAEKYAHPDWNQKR
ncbi:MAG TPA: biotin/lipoate A/B protein ligase family protein [Anaerolineae bacterium]|nr:biotin/lipoate A/B protein ligase family protein [Anaerolineae bacterium]